MDWVDDLSIATYAPLPDLPPVYWGHGLIKHLGLPDEWPVDWASSGTREKAFTLFLETFDPPSNLQGLSHQVVSIEFIISDMAEAASIDQEYKQYLEMFRDQVADYISSCPKEEKETLTANQLDGITHLGIWRFHFHCSQVVRDKIDDALNKGSDSDVDEHNARIINVSKLEYLRDGPVDLFYQAIAGELHRDLKRREAVKAKRQEAMMLSRKVVEKLDASSESISKKAHLIYNESLACEHCLHLAHHLIQKGPSKNRQGISTEFKSVLRQLSKKETGEDALKNYTPDTADLIRKVAGYIRTVHRLLSTFGGYQERRSGKRKKFTIRHRSRIGRLMPLGRYEEDTDENESTESVQIDDPLDIINGIQDDNTSEAILRRKYGRRPKMARDLGESEEDYKESNSIIIPASWLLDPYRNAIKQQVQAESLITSTEPPVWSSQCLMVNTIKQYIANASRSSSHANLLSVLALHTGLMDHMMRTIRIGIPPIFELLDRTYEIPPEDYIDLVREAETKWTDIYIDPDTSVYAYLMPKGMAAYYEEHSPSFVQGCERATRIIRIPLPQVVSLHLEKWLEILSEKHSGLLCANPDEPTTYLKLFRNWKQVSDEWADIMSNTGRMCFENVTPSRVRSTFRALYVGQMGLAPMCANLIMSEIPIHFRAQHFYANISYHSLQEQYHNASKTIARELSPKHADNPVEELKACETGDVSARRFGSRLVPTNERLSTYFSELHASFISDIEKTVMSPSSWNRMTLYVFRLLQLATGIRPARDSLPNWSDLSFKLNWIRLSDKDNLHYYESRIIPMATRLNQWLGYLGSLQSKYVIGMNFRRVGLPSPFRDKPTQFIFVFMDTKRKVIRSFTFDDLSLIEDAAQLTQPFNYKANALRHNLLTRLHESDIDQHIIDFIMGHKHFGSEPFGRFSPISSNKYANLATRYLDELIIDPVQIPEPPLNG